MNTAFIIHGSYGSPQENWFPWLKTELEQLGERVFVPQFPVPNVDPTPGGHHLDEWLKTFDQYSQYIDDQTIIIAHSRGCVFTYRLLERFQKPVKAVFLVAPWMVYRWYTERKEVDSFHKTPFDWKKMKKGSRHIEVFQSTNDMIPAEEGKEIAKKLGAEFVLVVNAGHFSTASNPSYAQFPLLLERIKKVLK